MRRYCVAATVLILTTSGCGAAPGSLAGYDSSEVAGSCDGARPAHLTSGSPTGEPSQLVIATDADTSRNQVRRQLIQKWNDTHPALNARLVELTNSTDLVHADVAAAAQNVFPRYDVLLLDIPWITEFAKAGYIQPLDGQGFSPDDFFPGRGRPAAITASCTPSRSPPTPACCTPGRISVCSR